MPKLALKAERDTFLRLKLPGSSLLFPLFFAAHRSGVTEPPRYVLCPPSRHGSIRNRQFQIRKDHFRLKIANVSGERGQFHGHGLELELELELEETGKRFSVELEF